MNTYDESPPEDETRIDGKQIKHLLAFYPCLDKIYMHDDRGRAALLECNVSEEIARQLMSRNRTNMHLVRLLRRPGTERDFALAFLRNALLLNRFDGANAVIASEGSDTICFWTFAPYVFHWLLAKGLREDSAFEKLFFWAEDGVSVSDFSKPGNFNDLHLKGTQHYSAEIGRVWILDRDPHHISHQYTLQESQKIAEILMQEWPLCLQFASGVDAKKFLSGAPVRLNIEHFLSSVLENPLPVQFYVLTKGISDRDRDEKRATHYSADVVY